MITRSTDALLKRKNKNRLILDVDSTEDPAHGNLEQMAYNVLTVGVLSKCRVKMDLSRF